MVLRRLAESLQVISRRQPSGYRIDDPESFEDLAVGLCSCLGRLFTLAAGRGSADCLVGRRRRCRCAVRHHPTSQHLRTTDCIALFLEIGVDDAAEVAIELKAKGSA